MGGRREGFSGLSCPEAYRARHCARAMPGLVDVQAATIMVGRRCDPCEHAVDVGRPPILERRHAKAGGHVTAGNASR